MPSILMLGCYDCGLPYRSPAFADFVVSDDVWRKLTAIDEANLLCATCMVRRGELLGIVAEGASRQGHSQITIGRNRVSEKEKRMMDWHRDFPPDTEEAWDMMAKALLIRLGGSVSLSELEMRQAAETACEIALDETGAFHFRREATN